MYRFIHVYIYIYIFQDPQSLENHGLLGYFLWLWAIILHPFGVQVQTVDDHDHMFFVDSYDLM